MSGYHAPVAPSNLALIAACQATLRLSHGLPPEPETQEAMEGNAADWVAKQYARGVDVPYGTVIPLPGNYTVDYDMIHGAKMWRDALGYGAVSGVPVVCSRIHPSACWGEPDGWQWFPIEYVLRVPDYKYGFGIVDLFTLDGNGRMVFNWQLLAYVAGLLETLNLNDTEVTVEFVIVQPRAYHREGPVRKHRIRADYLRAQINEAWQKTALAWPTPDHGDLGPEPAATTGVHCELCPARGVCEAYQQQGTRTIESVGRMQRINMDPASVGAELLILEQSAKILDGRLTALRAQAEGFLRAAKPVPNWHMAPGDGGFKWNEGVTVQELEALATTCGLTLRNVVIDPHSRKPPVVTPSQAVKAGIDEAVILQYASKVPGAMKLTRQSKTDAIRAFGIPSTETT